MKMQKILTVQPESGDLRKDTEYPKYFIDKKGEVWEWLGNCTGPKVAFFTDDGKKVMEDLGRGNVQKVRWISPGLPPWGNPFPMTNQEFLSLLKNPSLGERWRTEETPRISPDFLKKFYGTRADGTLRRQGCNFKIYAPATELDARNKGVTCSWCGSIGEFHGTPIPGSVADRAFQEAKAKKATAKG